MLGQNWIKASLIDRCGTATVCVGSDGRICYANAACSRIFADHDPLESRPLFDIIRLGRPTEWSDFWAGFADAPSQQWKANLLNGAGLESAEVVFDLVDDGDRPMLLAMIHCSQAWSKLTELRQTESFHRSIMESSLDSIFLLDLDARILFINRTAPGLSLEQVINTSVYEYVAPQFHPTMQACFEQVTATAEPGSYEVDYLRKDGALTTWESQVAPVLTDGKVTGMTVFARDVTEHRRAMDALSASERTLANAQSIARIGSWEFDIATGVATGTEEMFRILGIPDTASLPTMVDLLSDFVHPEDRQYIVDSFQKAIVSGKVDSLEFRLLSGPNKVVRHIRADADYCREEDGSTARLIGTFQDITRQKEGERSLRRMEAQLAHVSRLSTLGEMVAGIAHEVNQPLSAIANFAYACGNAIELSQHQFDVPIESWLQQINEQAVRCGDIIRRLRGFVKKDDDDRQVVDLNQVVRDSVALVTSSNSDQKRQEFLCEFGNPAPHVLANQVQMQQVVVNLLRNACDATQQLDSPRIIVKAESHEQLAILAVEDNGHGVSDDKAASLFDAFYTTKSDGLGVGLAISKSIVEAHHGKLSFESIVPGARFVVALPRTSAETSLMGRDYT